MSSVYAQQLGILADYLSETFPDQNLSRFYIRLGHRFDVLLDLYQRLYGEHQAFDDRLSELVAALAQMYLERSDELRALDQDRAQDESWFMSPNWVATMLYVDRFSDDLKGFKEKIGYLEELGINYVHLMPLLKMPGDANDGGYAVSDYRSVDERFGTMDDIREIGAIFREEKMLLELDLVLNHTADDHEWARRALAGETEYQDFYYFYDDRRIPDLFEQTLSEVFPDTAPGNFTYIESLDKWVFTTFNTFQWDLNYTNPRVFTEMVKILLNLANQGVDILRLDAVAFMWKRLGTDSQNLEEAHLLLQLFKVCTKIVAPGVIFKAEAIVQPKEIVKYLGGGEAEECDIAYNASFMVYLWDTMATQNKLILEKGLEHIPRLPENTTWVNYVRCHDDIGLGYADEDILLAGFNPFDHRQFIISYYVGEYGDSMARGERFMFNPKTRDARITGSTASLLGLETALEKGDEPAISRSIDKFLLMHSLIMSFGGIPLVYYGDELASLNDYSYLQDDTKSDDNRWLNRPIIDWQRAERRTKKGTVEQRVFDGIKKMIALRKTLPEFHNANDFQLINNDNAHIFCFLRKLDWHQTLVVANLSQESQSLAESVIEQTGFGHYLRDYYSDHDIEPSNGKYLLAPFQVLWLKQR